MKAYLFLTMAGLSDVLCSSFIDSLEHLLEKYAAYELSAKAGLALNIEIKLVPFDKKH